MAMETKVVGDNLDTIGNIKVALTADPIHAGLVRNMSENDAGGLTGTPTLRSAEVSQDYRLRVGTDTVLFYDTFNATAQNISLYKYTFSTMTSTMSSGFLNINAAGTSTAASNYSALQSQRYFALIGTSPLAVEFVEQFDRVPVANEVFLFGLGVTVGAGEPVDGCWFEYTDAGLKGCMRYNSGVVSKTPPIISCNNVDINTTYKFCMVIGARDIEFWVNDELGYKLSVDMSQGQPFLTASLPLFMVKYNNALVGTSPNTKMQVSNVCVTLMDISSNMAWANQMASSGLCCQQLNGGTAGNPQIQWANTALPTAAAATNTTAALGAYLGGLFQMNAPATSATDLIVSSYLNPLGSVTQTPRTIKLRGIKVDCINTVVAVATTATVFAVALAQGGTALTLAQTETASFATNTTKARRIQPLGVISFPIAAPIGTMATPIQFDFEAPLVINPGEYLQVIVKPILGTATSTEVFVQVISPNLYHE